MAVRGLISTNAQNISSNATAISTINALLNNSYIYSVTYNNRTFTFALRNISDGTTSTVTMTLPLAGANTDGFMPSSAWNDLQSALSDIQELFDQSWLVISQTPISTASDAQTAWVNATGTQPREGVGVIDQTDGDLWKFGNVGGVDTWVQITSGTFYPAFDNFKAGGLCLAQ